MPKARMVKYVGEGSYGCVVKPEIKCSDISKPIEILTWKPRTELVSKIFADKDSYYKEINASLKMEQVDPSGKNFLIPKRACLLTSDDMSKHPETNKCDVIVDHPQPVYYQLQMPYGGVKFDVGVKHEAGRKPMSPKKLLVMMKPLFHALVLLDKHQVCHMDIKPGNVLVTPQGDPIIIDYSLVKPFKDIYLLTSSRRFRKTYYPYPPEFKILGFSKSLSDHNKSNAIYKNYSYGDVLNMVLENFDHRYASDYFRYFSMNEISSAVKDSADDIDALSSVTRIFEYMSPFANRIDIYSVGMLIVYVTQYIAINFDASSNSKKDRIFINFVRTLIHPQVTLRATPTSAMKMYTKTIKSL